MNTAKVLSDCSMKVTPAVLNILTGLAQENIRIGEMIMNTDSIFKSGDGTIVRITYTKGIVGECYLIIDTSTRDKLVGAMMGFPTVKDMGLSKEMLDSATCELMNQISGSIISAASDTARQLFDISCPEIIDSKSISLNKDYKIILNIFHNADHGITVKLVNCVG